MADPRHVWCIVGADSHSFSDCCLASILAYLFKTVVEISVLQVPVSGQRKLPWLGSRAVMASLGGSGSTVIGSGKKVVSMGRKRRSTIGRREQGTRPTPQAKSDMEVRHWSNRSVRLIMCLIGLLFAAGGFFLASGGLTGATKTSQDLAEDNSLLVAQQLDALFWNIDKRLSQNAAELSSFYEILQVFYLYDRRFVEQNENNLVTQAETAYANQRLAQCAKIFGDFDQSKAYYRKAKQQFEGLVNENPNLISQLHDLIDAQANVADLEQVTGNTDLSKREFQAAIRLLDQSSIPKSMEYHQWLAPQFRSLADIGKKLGLDQDALDLARRFDESASALAQSNFDAEVQQQALEAKAMLESISSGVR